MSARVLVVDDILANRRLMKAKLEAHYYTVLLAENGQDALDKALHEKPHIILLDVMMPGMDGYEVCERLKADDRTQHIPVVMLTALSEAEDRIRGLEAGADDFLSKPIDDFALTARLEALTRYNLVAHELRAREATSQQGTVLTDDERAELERPADVLVIDSAEAEANRLAAALREVGHQVLTWQEGQDRGRNVLSGVDVIVLALSDQNHDALRLCAQLRTLQTRNAVSIIVTFDVADGKSATQALALGASDMVANPVNHHELQARVRTQVKRSRYVEILRRRVDRGLELSVIDQLTGLYNRRYMLSQLKQWMKRAASGVDPLSVVAFDIDHFKHINDEHGHEAGDNVLKAFAERIQMNVRPKDIVCRPGGEEFLVIMPETPGDLACVGAERIRHAIADEMFDLKRDNTSVDITVSAGVATYSGKDDTLADLLHRADQALYRAKQLGRNRTESLAA